MSESSGATQAEFDALAAKPGSVMTTHYCMFGEGRPEELGDAAKLELLTKLLEHEGREVKITTYTAEEMKRDDGIDRLEVCVTAPPGDA
jgi:hypothetical protein